MQDLMNKSTEYGIWNVEYGISLKAVQCEWTTNVSTYEIWTRKTSDINYEVWSISWWWTVTSVVLAAFEKTTITEKQLSNEIWLNDAIMNISLSIWINITWSMIFVDLFESWLLRVCSSFSIWFLFNVQCSTFLCLVICCH